MHIFFLFRICISCLVSRWGHSALSLALKYKWGDEAISWLLSLGADISVIPPTEARDYLDR